MLTGKINSSNNVVLPWNMSTIEMKMILYNIAAAVFYKGATPKTHLRWLTRLKFWTKNAWDGNK